MKQKRAVGQMLEKFWIGEWCSPPGTPNREFTPSCLRRWNRYNPTEISAIFRSEYNHLSKVKADRVLRVLRKGQYWQESRWRRGQPRQMIITWSIEFESQVQLIFNFGERHTHIIYPPSLENWQGYRFGSAEILPQIFNDNQLHSVHRNTKFFLIVLLVYQLSQHSFSCKPRAASRTHKSRLEKFTQNVKKKDEVAI